jgi:FtsZ-binding cell division protein ZapB
MSEFAILGTVAACLWGVTLALLGVVWGLHRASITSLDNEIEKLRSQNTVQEVAIGRLTENALSREQIHAQHREDVQSWVGRLETQINAMMGKLDRVLSSGRYGTPYPGPGRYGPEGKGT